MRVALLAALTLIAPFLAGCSADDGAAPDPCKDVTKASLTLNNANHTVVAIATDHGCIVAELYDNKAPVTVSNFLNYTREKFYDGVLFHRIIKDFMVQTGGMDEDGEMKTASHPPIVNEARSSGLKNQAYWLAMARQGRNSDGTGDGANTATSQFFINHKANPTLDATNSSAGYAPFGKVVQGREVVDAIAATPVQAYKAGTHCQPDVTPSCPTEDVVLYSIRVVEA